MKGAIIQIDNRKERSKIHISVVFDGRNKTNIADANIDDLVKEKQIPLNWRPELQIKGFNEY